MQGPGKKFLITTVFLWAVFYSVHGGFQTIGCYRDTSNRAITTLEGSDPVLDGSYQTRKDPIAKCAVAALKRGYTMFAVQNGGWCAASAIASFTYDKYGRSSACKTDGEGGPWANQVYLGKGYQTVGCYKDTRRRAISTLEGNDLILDGSYWTRKDPIAKCAVAALKRGYTMFAVQNGGWCAASPIASTTYFKYGRSSACKSDGEGGPWANQVYAIRVKGYETVGCYKDTSNRAISTFEGTDPILDGSYETRMDPIAKCAVAAMRKGYSMFAVQNGGWCAGSSKAPHTFTKYGRSSACKPNGEGGPWANQVYVTKGYETVGCYKDTSHRAISTLEGKDFILDGSYWTRKYPIAKCALGGPRTSGRKTHAAEFVRVRNYRLLQGHRQPSNQDSGGNRFYFGWQYWSRENPIEKCAVAAMKKGYSMFAVQHGGWCAASDTAPKTFDKYGKSTACGVDGEGGGWANQVYLIKGYETIGCYRDTGNRAIRTLEGTDSILDGSYWTRENPIEKCAVAAMRKGYSMFAVQHGGWCAGSIIAPHTFNKYGRSTACGGDGEGGPWANQVYFFKPFFQHWHDVASG